MKICTQHCSLFHFEARNKVGLEQNLLQNEAKSEKWSRVGNGLRQRKKTILTVSITSGV